MVHTRLAEVRKKKQIETNVNNVNKEYDSSFSPNDSSTSNLFNGPLLKVVVCETQTQMVNSTQDDDVSFKGFELEKTPPVPSTDEKCTGDRESGEKSSEAPKVTTPPSKKRKAEDAGSKNIDLPTKIEFRKFGYLTPDKTPFALDDNLLVTPTHLTPTPELDAWFIDDDDQRHCSNLINNLDNFPFEGSKEWLNNNFRQFKKFVTDNGLTRVKLLTNLWLKDGKQHSFPASTPEDKYLPGAKARLDKDLQYEELNRKNSFTEENQIFTSLNCKITEILNEKERKSVVASLKKISACLMTSQKMYAKHFASYEKQQNDTLADYLKLTMLQQETGEKNLILNQQNAKLEATVDKLRFQLRQKNVHESDLKKSYLAQKREQKATDENKILKLERELTKLKEMKSTNKDSTKLECEKLKERLHSCKTLHKEQIQMKDGRISDQQATIKSQKSKINNLEKSLSKLQSQFNDFQRQSALDIAKVSRQKELIEIRDNKKKSIEQNRKKEKAREKESQKKKLEEAIRMNQSFAFMPNSKHTQEKILNNFRSGHLPPPPYVSPHHQYPRRGYQSYGTEAIDLTGPSDHSASMAGMMPDIFSLLDDLSSEKREKKKVR